MLSRESFHTWFVIPPGRAGAYHSRPVGVDAALDPAQRGLRVREELGDGRRPATTAGAAAVQPPRPAAGSHVQHQVQRRGVDRAVVAAERDPSQRCELTGADLVRDLSRLLLAPRIRRSCPGSAPSWRSVPYGMSGPSSSDCIAVMAESRPNTAMNHGRPAAGMNRSAGPVSSSEARSPHATAPGSGQPAASLVSRRRGAAASHACTSAGSIRGGAGADTSRRCVIFGIDPQVQVPRPCRARGVGAEGQPAVDVGRRAVDADRRRATVSALLVGEPHRARRRRWTATARFSRRRPRTSKMSAKSASSSTLTSTSIGSRA